MGCCGESRAPFGDPNAKPRSVAQSPPRPKMESTDTYAIVGNVHGELELPSGAKYRNVRPGVVIRVKKTDLSDPRIVEHGQKSSETYRAFR